MIYSLYTLLLLGSLLFGLILLVIGAFLLLRVKNKIAGILVLLAGLTFGLCPLGVFTIEVIAVRAHG